MGGSSVSQAFVPIGLTSICSMPPMLTSTGIHSPVAGCSSTEHPAMTDRYSRQMMARRVGFSFSSILFPGLNFTLVRAGIAWFVPFFGFRPGRAA